MKRLLTEFLKSLNIKSKFEERSLLLNYIFSIPEKLMFENAEVFEKFLMLFLNESFSKTAKIRSENLKLIAQSEHLIQLLRERSDRITLFSLQVCGKYFNLLMNHFHL